MGTGFGRLRLAAFAVFAAGQCAAWAGPQDTSPVYWGEAQSAERVDQAAFVDGQRRRVRYNQADVSARQIDPGVAREPERRVFAAWYCRRGLWVKLLLCERLARAGSGESLLVELGEEAAAQAVEVLPINADAPPVTYAWMRRHWPLRRRAPESGAPLGPSQCGCQQEAAILQSGTGSGGNSAGILQAGPNTAIIAQQVLGAGVNVAFASQWGACNQAFIAQAAAAGATNRAVVYQAGYRNVAVVLQH